MTTAASAALPTAPTDKILSATVLVSGFGYMVDMYDLLMCRMVRIPALTELGFAGDALTAASVYVINYQSWGLLLGALMWGMLADKYGRKSCLLASILTYSLASLWSGFVQDVDSYALSRLVAGFGLAGELGVGIALITEKLDANRRGYGAMLFIAFGFVGVVLAAIAAEYMNWRNGYITGGVAGLALLLARSLLQESGMFHTARDSDARRGNLRLLFSDRRRVIRFVCTILVPVPILYAINLLWTLSPELAGAMGITETVKPNIVMAVGYGSVIGGDLLAVWISEKLKSRKRAMLYSQLAGAAAIIGLFLWPVDTLNEYYVFMALIGFTLQGTWILSIILAAEQFGTNLRATTAALIPNLARASAIPMNLLFLHFKPDMGTEMAMVLVGAIVVALGFAARYGIAETYGRDLNYQER